MAGVRMCSFICVLSAAGVRSVVDTPLKRRAAGFYNNVRELLVHRQSPRKRWPVSAEQTKALFLFGSGTIFFLVVFEPVTV